MNLYRLTQDDVSGFDTFDSCIVAAATDQEAVRIHPILSRDFYPALHGHPWDEIGSRSTWAKSPESVKFEWIGRAAPHIQPGVLCASFNAG